MRHRAKQIRIAGLNIYTKARAIHRKFRCYDNGCVFMEKGFKKHLWISFGSNDLRDFCAKVKGALFPQRVRLCWQKGLLLLL